MYVKRQYILTRVRNGKKCDGLQEKDEYLVIKG